MSKAKTFKQTRTSTNTSICTPLKNQCSRSARIQNYLVSRIRILPFFTQNYEQTIFTNNIWLCFIRVIFRLVHCRLHTVSLQIWVWTWILSTFCDYYLQRFQRDMRKRAFQYLSTLSLNIFLSIPSYFHWVSYIAVEHTNTGASTGLNETGLEAAYESQPAWRARAH